MATSDITKSGVFRSAYRMRIGDGTADQIKAGLTTDALIALTRKAEQKWPKSAFEFRLIEKDNGTFLEVLKQKQSTLDKDKKTKWSYGGKDGNQVALHQRDLRRASAAKLLVDKGFMDQAGVGASAYRAKADLEFQRPGDVGPMWRADDRGQVAAAMYRAVSTYLNNWCETELGRQALSENGAGTRRSEALLPKDGDGVARGPLIEQPQVIEIDPSVRHARQARLEAMNKRREAGVDGRQLHVALEKSQSAQSSALGRLHQDVQAQPVLLAGRHGRALRVEHSGEGAPQVRFLDLGLLRKFNTRGAYASAQLSERAGKALMELGAALGLAAEGQDSLQSLQQRLSDSMNQAERTARASVDKNTVGTLWTTSALPDAVGAVAQGLLDQLHAQEATLIAQGANPEDAGAHDQQLAAIGAQRLLVQLAVLEQLCAVTTDPTVRQALLQEHQSLSEKLVALAGTACGELDRNELSDHLQQVRGQAAARGAAAEPQHFESAAAAKQLEKQQRSLKQAQQAIKRQAKLPKREDYQQAIEDARRLLQARRDVRAQGAKAAGLNQPDDIQLEPLHKVPTPPRGLSNDSDWLQLCDYVDALEAMRKANGQGGGLAAQRAQGVGDPEFAAKILNTMRLLMEDSLRDKHSVRQVYVPSMKPGGKGTWMQAPEFLHSPPLASKQNRVAVAQLMELEMLIAHSPAADVAAVSRLLSLHDAISDVLLSTLGQDPSLAADELKTWTQRSRERVKSLRDEFLKAAKRPDPEVHEVLNRAHELFNESLDAAFKARVRQAEQTTHRLAEARSRSEEGLESGFPPADAEAAIDQLFTADSSAGDRAAASRFLIRQFQSGASGPSAQERAALADELAQRIAAEPNAAGVPAQLKLLASASKTEAGVALAQSMGTSLKVALLGQRVWLEGNEQSNATALLDNGRLVSAEEMSAHLGDVIDSRRIAMVSLRKDDDSESTLANSATMAKRFKEEALAHFEKADEQRPLASTFLVDGNSHWVSLVAERASDGGIVVSALDTNTAETPRWFNTVSRELTTDGLLDGQAPRITASLFKAPLQEGLRPNACGPLQAQALQAVQGREAGQSVGQALRDWTAKRDSDHTDTDRIAWQLRADRAAMLQSALEAGEAVLAQNQDNANIILRNLARISQSQLEKLDEAWSSDPRDAGKAAEHLNIVKSAISKCREELGDLYVVNDAANDVRPASQTPELDRLEMMAALYGLMLGSVKPSEALADMQNAYANAVERKSPDELREFESFVGALKQETGVELLSPTVLDAEAQALTELRGRLGTLSEASLASWVKDLLPQWGEGVDAEGPAAVGAYLNRYPQRADRLALLADAYDRMAVISNDDEAANEGWKAEAYSIRTALADNRWVSDKLQAEQRQKAEQNKPQDVLSLHPENKANIGFELEKKDADALRHELEDYLRSVGLERLIYKDPDAPEVAELDDAEVDLIRRQSGDSILRSTVVGDPQQSSDVRMSLSDSTQSQISKAGFEEAKGVLNQRGQGVAAKKVTDAQGAYIKDIEKWASTREGAVIDALFNKASGKKGWLSGMTSNTWGQFTAPPPLKTGSISTPEQVWQLGELMLLEALRGKKDRASQIFEHYLRSHAATARGGLGDLQSSQMVQSRSPLQTALLEVSGLHQALQVSSRLLPGGKSSVLETPKIRRNLTDSTD